MINDKIALLEQWRDWRWQAIEEAMYILGKAERELKHKWRKDFGQL